MKNLRISFTLLMAGCVGVLSAQENRIALVQSSFVWGDYGANIAAFDSKIAQIEGCDLIILPELFTSGCDMQKRDKEVKDRAKREIASKYEEVVQKMQQWAKQSGSVIIGSTIYQEGEHFYNRLLAVYPSSQYYYYDKHNCYKNGSFASGKEHLVIEVNGHRYATYICYDLRFSEWSANNDHYDTAIYIANWPESRSEDWERLLSERAVENNANVIGVNCVGQDPGGINFLGQSSIYSADGALRARCKDNQQEILIY